jgi:hypothetical protein
VNKQDQTIVYDPSCEYTERAYAPEHGKVLLNSSLEDLAPNALVWNEMLKDIGLAFMFFMVAGILLSALLRGFGVGHGFLHTLTPYVAVSWGFVVVYLQWIPRCSK